METQAKYGAHWPAELDDLDIEMGAIEMGGTWKTPEGTSAGLGLSRHYENMRRIIWPELDTHRWHELCRDEMVKNKVTVLMGPKSSGKTHEASWYGLCKYFVFPETTCVLVSSTDMRGLKLRVWAEISMLWRTAIERFPQLPGHYLDSKVAITTDALDDGDIDKRTVRDMRKAIVGIPCIQGGKFVGLGKYCFATGTLVDTASGPVPIESIRVGDFVWSKMGLNRVTATAEHYAPTLVRVHLSDGSHIDCTPEHRFLTTSGWKNAIDIPSQTYLISPHEKLSGLREATSETSGASPVLLQNLPARNMAQELRVVQQVVHSIRGKGHLLQQDVRCKMEMETTGNCPQVRRAYGPQGSRPENFRSHHGQSKGTPEAQGENDGLSEKVSRASEGAGSISMGRLWNRPQNASQRIDSEGSFSRSESQHGNSNRRIIETGEHAAILARLVLARHSTGSRSGWSVPPSPGTKGTRFQEGLFPKSKRVDRVEILSERCDPRYNHSAKGYRVHNLQVEGSPTYSVHGCIVHNCGIKQKNVLLIADELAFMGQSFLTAFANLDGNENFQAICLGNPNDIMDQLGKAAEPLDGWSSHMEPTKTEVWATRFMGGRCVNLIGTDSPNFDYPEDQPTKFKYLISREKIANTASFFSKDSLEFYSQCKGCMKISALARRVITRELCRQNHTEKDVIWEGPGQIRIAGLDAAYGGDRCVCMFVEVGKEVGGKTVIKFNPPQIVPVRVSADVPAEQSIAEWCKDYCTQNHIEPQNFFHDSTGRGSLGTYLARVWSDQCNPIEFGGNPTDRPVSLDMYVYDQRTSCKRLKKCSEHYRKFVTELWFSLRYAIESGQVRNLPEDVMEEGCMREWHNTKDDKKELETKQEMKDRVGRSPDLYDCASICCEGARRRGFQISKLANEEASTASVVWLRDLQAKARKFREAHDLDYSVA